MWYFQAFRAFELLIVSACQSSYNKRGRQSDLFHIDYLYLFASDYFRSSVSFLLRLFSTRFFRSLRGGGPSSSMPSFPKTARIIIDSSDIPNCSCSSLERFGSALRPNIYDGQTFSASQTRTIDSARARSIAVLSRRQPSIVPWLTPDSSVSCLNDFSRISI